jgi:hypothetical protein
MAARRSEALHCEARGGSARASAPGSGLARARARVTESRGNATAERGGAPSGGWAAG